MSSTKNLQRSDGTSFWLTWVILPALGFAAVQGLGDYLLDPLPFIPLFWFIFGLAAGLVFGALQWLILTRRLAPVTVWWIGATAVGFGVGFVLGDGIPAAWTFHPLGILAQFGRVAFGLIVGSLQWFFLRQQLRRAGWWVAANAAGFYLGYVLFSLTLASGGPFGNWPWGLIAQGALQGGLVGAIVGALTAVVLRRLE
jgi:hypothetical protein